MKNDDLIKTIIQQQDSYRTMMQWAISGMIGILVVFFTANLFITDKMTKDEKAKIKAEITSEIVTKHTQEIKSEIENKLELDLTRDIENLTGDIKDLKADKVEMEGAFIELEGDIYQKDDYYGNAYSSYFRALEDYIKVDSFHIPFILDKLENSAKKLDYIDAEELAEFNIITKKIDLEYQTQMDRIKKVLVKLPPSDL